MRQRKVIQLVFLSVTMMLLLAGVGQAANGTWTTNGPAGTAIGSLASDPRDAAVVYAGAGTQGVFRSTDAGTTWLPKTAGLASPVSTVAVSGSGTVYAGTAGSGIFKSTNRAETWTAASAGLTNLNITSVAVTPLTIYVGTPAGVFKSNDQGESWHPTGLAAGIFVVTADPSESLIAYASAGYDGLYRTTDGGMTWSLTGPPNTYTLRITVDSSDPRTIFLGSNAGAIFKSSDRGTTWNLVFQQPQNRNISAIAVDPAHPSVVYAGSGPFESIYRTLDGGSTWHLFDAGLPNLYVPALLISLGRVYAGTASEILGGAGVFTIDTTQSCTATATALCLNTGRFQVAVTWRALNIGTAGIGQAVPLTEDTGYFWFFTSNNVELIIKVVDGRAFNNHYWVFFGAMSDVEYTITVTDTQTGLTRTYANAQGQLASIADTSAF